MNLLTIILLALLSGTVFSQQPYTTEPNLRIRIINSVEKLTIVFNGEWELKSKDEKRMVFQSGEEIDLKEENGKLIITRLDEKDVETFDHFLLKSLKENGSLKIKNVPFGVGWWWESKEDRIYEGELRFYTTSKNKIEVVVHLPLEQYLKGVVPYEIGNNSPLEALKAQAVAARSEGIMALNSNLFRGENHDLTSDVECQVFSGNSKRTLLSDSAVEETKSIVLGEKGKPINAYYSSNCGGHSELIENVWGDRPGIESYAVSGFDTEDLEDVDLSNEVDLRKWLFSNQKSYCNPNTTSGLPNWSQNNFRWKTAFTIEAISKMTAKGKDLGALVDIKVLKRGKSGRAIRVIFLFEKDVVEVKGELKIRQMFAPPLRSANFVLDKTDSEFTFYGAGWGHGVGMCQSGAIGMAKSGKSYEEILKHYYRKADLMRVY